MTEAREGHEFGTWLAALRKELDLTQIELADAVGCSRAAIQKFESGTRRPSKAMAERMAAILHISDVERATFLGLARNAGAAVTSTLTPPSSSHSHYYTHTIATSSKADWSEAPDVSRFYGRQAEVEQLRQWLTEDRCKLVAVLGMGGIGKTALTTLTAMLVQEQYAAVIWRSLRNAPPVAEFLGQIIAFLSDDYAFEPPASVEQLTARLLGHLRLRHCLLVLDNFETVLDAHQPGHYLPGFEGYGQLLKHIGEGRHQSSLLVTSREKPKELISLAGDAAPVRTLLVHSLDLAPARALLRDLRGSEQNWEALHARYSGNPLALQIISEIIRELFAGEIAQFLQEDTFLFGGIADLLAQQHSRLSPLEEEVMFWLAIDREPVTAEDLAQDLVDRPNRQMVLAALHSLRLRSLVERVQTGFTLQNVVLEYFTAALVQQVGAEICCMKSDYLRHFALLKVTAKNYVQESQRALILRPVAQHLAQELGQGAVGAQLAAVLAYLHSSEANRDGYAAGNILNLMVHLGIDLQSLDFSHLAVWQADLRHVTAQDLDFRGANFARTAFTETFDGITSVAFSPDGQRLAASTTGGEIRIWQVSDAKPLLAWAANAGWVRSVCFAPDGSTVVTGGADGTVCLWDANSGGSLATLHGHTSDVVHVCFSPDGSLLASGGVDRTIGVWDRYSGRCLNVLKGHRGDVNSVCFSPDGGLLASSSADHTVRVWDSRTGQCLYVLHAHTSWVWCVSFSPDGDRLASGSEDQTIRVWDRHTGRCLHTLGGHTASVRSLRFSPDGKTLASGSFDQTVRLWDVQQGQYLHTCAGHTGHVWCVCFSPDSSLLASGAFDQTLRVWNVATRQCLRTFEGHTGWFWSTCFSPDGGLLAGSSIDRSIQLWDRHTGQFLRSLRGHTGPVKSVCFSPDGSLLASGSFDQTVRLWDRQTGRCLRSLDEHTGWVWSVCFSPDGSRLASGGDDQIVRVWDLAAGRCLHTLDGHAGAVRSVCFSPDGSRLASGGDDQIVRVWDLATGRCLHTLGGHAGSVRAVCFSPDGVFLASCARDQAIYMWDSHTGQCVRTLDGHTGWVWSVCFSPDGSMLASASGDKTVRLWCALGGRTLATLQGHTGDVMSICFTPDGAVLASGSGDETIRLWDVNARVCSQVLHGERPYEGMNITEATGLASAQVAALKRLGALQAWIEPPNPPR